MVHLPGKRSKKKNVTYRNILSRKYDTLRNKNKFIINKTYFIYKNSGPFIKALQF